MRYPPSVFTADMTRCYLCGSNRNIEIHHVYPSGLRKKSTQYGMVVPLCRDCHQGPKGVHSCIEKMNRLRAEGQRLFELRFPSESFLEVFKRNWK